MKQARVVDEKLRLKYKNLGDFGGTDPVRDMWVLEIAGPTYKIKDQLKRLGMRWDPNTKTWKIEAILYSYRPGRNDFYGNRKLQEKAYPKLKELVRQHNQEVLEQKSELMPEKSTKERIKERIKEVMHYQRQNRWLSEQGIQAEYLWPDRYSVNEPKVAITGDTFPYRDVFKKFGWKWNSSRKRWELPMDEFDVVQRKFTDALSREVAMNNRQSAYRAAIASVMNRNASNDVYDNLRGEISKRLDQIQDVIMREQKRAFAEFKKMGFEVNERASYMDYRLHGSDGLRVGGVIKFEDPQGRTKEQIDRLIEKNGIFEISWVQKNRSGGGWSFGFGDDI